MFPFNLSLEDWGMIFFAATAVVLAINLYFAYSDIDAMAGNESHITPTDIRLLADEAEELQRTLDSLRKSNA